MRSLSSTAAVLTTLLLALILLAYVFTGRVSTQKKPHCTTRQSMELVKREMFRRAGEATGAMGRFSSNVVVHAVSPILRMHHAGTNQSHLQRFNRP